MLFFVSGGIFSFKSIDTWQIFADVKIFLRVKLSTYLTDQIDSQNDFRVASDFKRLRRT